MKLKFRREKNRMEDLLDRKIQFELECAHTPEALRDVIELVKLRNEALSNTPRLIKPDTVLLVVGNLAGILLILNFERMNVITTKALGFVLRGGRA